MGVVRCGGEFVARSLRGSSGSGSGVLNAGKGTWSWEFSMIMGGNS